MVGADAPTVDSGVAGLAEAAAGRVAGAAADAGADISLVGRSPIGAAGCCAFGPVAVGFDSAWGTFTPATGRLSGADVAAPPVVVAAAVAVGALGMGVLGVASVGGVASWPSSASTLPATSAAVAVAVGAAAGVSEAADPSPALSSDAAAGVSPSWSSSLARGELSERPERGADGWRVPSADRKCCSKDGCATPSGVTSVDDGVPGVGATGATAGTASEAIGNRSGTIVAPACPSGH